MITDELRNMKPLTGKERLGMNRQSEYLGAEDLDPESEPILTIQAIYNGMVTLARGKENKDVMVFAENSVPGIKNVRPMIVNATNRKILRKLFKSVSAETLVGKRIQLYLVHDVRDPSTGDKVDGIRIRQTVPKEPEFKCAECGKKLESYQGMAPAALADYTRKKYGRVLCSECAVKTAGSKEETK